MNDKPSPEMTPQDCSRISALACEMAILAFQGRPFEAKCISTRTLAEYPRLMTAQIIIAVCAQTFCVTQGAGLSNTGRFYGLVFRDPEGNQINPQDVAPEQQHIVTTFRIVNSVANEDDALTAALLNTITNGDQARAVFETLLVALEDAGKTR